MAEVQAYERKIKLVRCKMGEFLKNIKDFSKLGNEFKDSDSFLNLQIAEIAEEYAKVKNLHSEIMSYFAEDDENESFKKYRDDNVYSSTQTLYFKYSTNLRELLKIVSNSERHDMSFSELSTSAAYQRMNINPALGMNPISDISLAILGGSLSAFDGSYDQWADFKDNFTTNVHENKTLNDGAKLKILQSLLKGDAAKIIKREFGTSKSTDYESIWTKLNKRFNHRRTLIYSYFQVLFYQTPLQKETSEGLKKLYDTTFDSLLDLKKLGLPTEHWGDLMVYLVHTKLPIRTKEIWDEKLGRSDQLPKYENFMTFLENRFRTLESIENTRKNCLSIDLKKSHSSTKKLSTLQTTENQGPSKPQIATRHCRVCKTGMHGLRKCSKFISLKPFERKNLVKSLGYCINCLSFSHKLADCESEGRCAECGGAHNSLLHFGKKASNSKLKPVNESQTSITLEDDEASGTSQTEDRGSQSNITCLSESNSNIIFPTALVKVLNSEGHCLILRALIDSCSDASYISKSAATKLNLPFNTTFSQTRGLGDIITAESKQVTTFQIQSLNDNSFKKSIDAYILPKISSCRPSQNFKLQHVLEDSIILADPNFNCKSNIDLLLGDGIDTEIKKQGFLKSRHENICFQETSLGWVISGSVPQSYCFNTICEPRADIEALDCSIRRFWEVEELPNIRQLTEEERFCEEFYKETTTRLSSGRYCVRLPFKLRIEEFNCMRKVALSRFSILEKRLLRDSSLKKTYADTINEYIQLGQMHEVDSQEFPGGYYIPHHCVFKESSSTTKLRVVFDASAKDKDSRSLNQFLFKGPRLQAELIDILTKFRLYRFAFTGDIAKMYRQIFIHSDDCKYQLIVWRDNPSQPIRTYAIDVVTFGTASAPYLAVKTLFRLADDEENSYPSGAKCLREGFYVDDCIFGANTLKEALIIQSEIRSILNSAGFHIRKWSANNPELLKNIPEADRETNSLLDFDSKMSVKTLGIQWSPQNDQFNFKISFTDRNLHTKRTVLSDIAKIFDPLGWLSPAIITAKLLIQDLWKGNKNWDEPLIEEHKLVWIKLREGLSKISSLTVPRWLFTTISHSPIEIHGFSDASQKAYAAVVYVKTIFEGKIKVTLLSSKTKVAPIKQISLPRLELMAAVMLANLVHHIKSTLMIPSASFHYWTDSQITLAWIKDEPQKRVAFVSNRIVEIQNLSNVTDWNYVSTKYNPADLGTRGINPVDLVESQLWWHGPRFLCEISSDNYQPADNCIEMPPEENIKSNKKQCERNTVLESFLSARRLTLLETSSNITQFSLESLNKYSTLSKLVRIIAYCLRLLSKNKQYRTNSYISPSEYEAALTTVVRMVQQEAYSEEIAEIEANKTVTKGSSLFALHPFLSIQDKTLRVCGRLGNSLHLNYDQKFPLILPRFHVFSQLIVRQAHLMTLHGTQQETLMFVCQRFHIIKAKSLVRFIVNRCVRCFRLKCTAQKQQMGLLPSLRVSPNRPFLNCGVDFAGPYDIKKYKGRCKSFYKSYFAIFICFATKAIHIEVVIDLSTASFIASFRRFISRRGLVQNLHSDCGTNFIGARRTVTRSLTEVHNKWNDEVSKELADFKTNWHNNPPGAPHFGGLWEAGVKSIKHHIKRHIGNTKLTYDEFETFLLQVESILNSRPLCQTPDNPDMMVLTPAHFLIQDSLIAMPDNNLELEKLSLQERWTLLQKLVQNFWKFWSQDYLNTLRQRSKWNHNSCNVKLNDVVLIMENNLPPNSWYLGRITKLHPGPDGLVRVVTLKTKSNEFQRPITKIVPLPIDTCN